ncbi:unnamed protein product [Moneuplotes crassus]|uniref:Uncharacterized protein n=1 Tax=Euplotes crassus TaxID=5936 RepID=A0AAD1Y9E6_EUPCR|nr:unnamed protein product [Moneuplotes crassus]
MREASSQGTKQPKVKRGRGRPRKYQDPDMYTRNIRMDTNDKAIIRAVRKEFIEFFRLFCVKSGFYNYENLSNDPLYIRSMKFEMSDDKFNEAMQEFVPFILQQDTTETVCLTDETLENMNKFLTVFVDFYKGPTITFPGSNKLMKDEMRSLFYSYSHRKFEAFLAVPEMRFVLHKVLNPGYIDTLISKNTTLKENEDIYNKCAEMILEKVEKHSRRSQE